MLDLVVGGLDMSELEDCKGHIWVLVIFHSVEQGYHRIQERCMLCNSHRIVYYPSGA